MLPLGCAGTRDFCDFVVLRPGATVFWHVNCLSNLSIA
jgi:hypothetical protein